MSLTPLIFMSIGILISFKYKIDAKKQKEITDAIQDLSIAREAIISDL